MNPTTQASRRAKRRDFHGLLNNLATTRLDPFARAFSRFHVRMNGTRVGRLLSRYFGAPVFQLTVRGRASGEPRSVMLMLTRRADDIIVVGSNAGHATEPNWFQNLRAARAARVRVGDESWDVSFRVLDGNERQECWALALENYPSFGTYQEHTGRSLPVALLERVRTTLTTSSHQQISRKDLKS